MQGLGFKPRPPQKKKIIMIKYNVDPIMLSFEQVKHVSTS